MNLLKIPKVQLSITLFLILLTAYFNSPSINIIRNLALALLSTIASDFIFLKLRKINFFPPTAAITTAIIITLILSPSLPPYEVFLSGMFAMFFKNFVRFSNRHVFNPAGVGVILTSFVFNHTVSWWAVSFQQVSNLKSLVFFLFLFSPFWISILRMRRFRIILSFLAANFILIYILSKSFTLNNFLDPTTLFFSLVMLPEPMTTPNNHSKQIVFGIFVAFLSLMISLSIFSMFRIPDPFILSLLIGNLVFFRLR